MKTTKLKQIVKEELGKLLRETEGQWYHQPGKSHAQTPAKQEYDALTTMISRLDGMESFLLNATRHKSDENLTQQAAEQLNNLRDTLSQLRRNL